MKIIPTTKGCHAFVDDEDYEWLSKYNWHYSLGYARTRHVENGRKISLGMHKLIMNPPEGFEVDHINGIKHDNRRENLRIVTRSQNSSNRGKNRKGDKYTSKFKGVYIINDEFHASIRCNDTRKFIGVFTNEIAAANAYNYYAKLYFNDYAKLNDVTYMLKDEWLVYKKSTTSNFRGVSWIDSANKWEVNFVDNEGIYHPHMGFFDDEIVAANYYNHLKGKEINQCDYISLEDCERKKLKRNKTSIYNGVSWDKGRNKWVVKTFHQKSQIHVGYYESEIEAALAYNEKIKELKINNYLKKINVVIEDDY